jgi:hypothetical protein
VNVNRPNEKSKAKIAAVKAAIKHKRNEREKECKALVAKTGETGWVRFAGREYCIVRRYGMSFYLLRKPEEGDEDA